MPKVTFLVEGRSLFFLTHHFRQEKGLIASKTICCWLEKCNTLKRKLVPREHLWKPKAANGCGTEASVRSTLPGDLELEKEPRTYVTLSQTEVTPRELPRLCLRGN